MELDIAESLELALYKHLCEFRGQKLNLQFLFIATMWRWYPSLSQPAKSLLTLKHQAKIEKKISALFLIVQSRFLYHKSWGSIMLNRSDKDEMKQTLLLRTFKAVGNGLWTFLKSESLDFSPDLLNTNLTRVRLRNQFKKNSQFILMRNLGWKTLI